MKLGFTLPVFAMLAMLLPGVAAAEKIASPYYAHWAKFKPGTTVTSEGIANMPMMPPATVKTVVTLKSVEPDHLVTTMAATISFDGHTMPQPPVDTKIPAEYDTENEGNVVSVGKETIEAMGKKIECDVYTIDTSQAKGEMHLKVWINSDIPGAVKMDWTAKVKDKKGNDHEMTYTVTIQSYEAK